MKMRKTCCAAVVSRNFRFSANVVFDWVYKATTYQRDVIGYTVEPTTNHTRTTEYIQY